VSVTALDHVVLTVTDAGATRRFYVDGLGFRWIEFEGRHALGCGRQKINLHYAGREFEPKAAKPTPGSGDLCFLTETALETVAARMTALGHPPIEGPVPRTGAVGALRSLYFRDPDGNLIEVAQQVADGSRPR
jgi:catechol 2,3-dioxygenase-like lactoylglutathione lyase family enzyme